MYNDYVSDLYKYIPSVPNFPKEGVNFKDITPLLENGEMFRKAIHYMENALKSYDFDKVLCPDARGFIFGAPMAIDFNKGLVIARKAGKLPRPGISKSYSLEYGSNIMEISAGSINPGDRVVIVDDLLATGGSVKALIDLVHESGGIPVFACFLIELLDLEGYKNISIEYSSIIKYGVRPGLVVMVDVSNVVGDDQLRYFAKIEAIIKKCDESTITFDWYLDDGVKEITVSKHTIKEIQTSDGWAPYVE